MRDELRKLWERAEAGRLSEADLGAAALTDLLEAANDRPEDTVLLAAIRQTVLPLMISVGPRWTGRDHYLAWYRTRGHAVPHRRPVGGEQTPHSLPSTNEVVPLAIRIAAALDPSDTFRRHLHSTATLGRDQAVRLGAVQAIAAGWAHHPDTLPLLRDRATDDDHWDVRQAAVLAIAAGWAGDPDTLPWLRERAAGDDEDVRQAAVRAIGAGWTDDPGTLPLLREHATTDDDGNVRRAAVRAIGAGWTDDPGTLPLLRDRATTDDDWEVRRTAMRAIAAGWAGDPDTLPLLRDRATTDDDDDVREAAEQEIAAILSAAPWSR